MTTNCCFSTNSHLASSYASYQTDERLEQRWKQLSEQGKRTCGVVSNHNPLDQPPDWFDLNRFTQAQRLARRHLFSLNMSHLIGNVLLVLLPEVLVPIAATGTSSTAYRVLLRVLSTVVHINAWYEGDPFDASTRIHASLLQVRRGCHLNVTRLLNQKYPDEKKHHPMLEEHNLWLSQYDMAMTQWSLIGIIAALPDACAFYCESSIALLNDKLIQLQAERSDRQQIVEFKIVRSRHDQFKLMANVFCAHSNESIESSSISIDLSNQKLKQLYELQEFMYLWRVLGHCMGVKQQFNVSGQTCFVRNIIFLRMCLDRGYRCILSEPNELVQIGLRLVKGMFLALSCIVPSWLITFEGFMKFWYDALRLPHNFKLKSFAHKFSYAVIVFTLNHMLKVTFLYRIWSFLFFWLLERLLKQVRKSERKVNLKYGNETYRVLDSKGIPFQIENNLYKSNV